ncbi:MAG: hypothetical protein ABWW70_07320 [Thermoproteota archaeon]
MRRKSDIAEALRRLKHKNPHSMVVITDRSTASSTRKIPLAAIEKIGNSYMLLKDSTIIPLHRVIMVIDESGRKLWTRARNRSNKTAS